LLQQGYSKVNYQSRVAIAGAIRSNSFHHRLQAAINGRVESINGKIIGLLGANAMYEVSKSIQLKVNGQRTYRNPTLSELYFFPGGNTNLKPEQGWNVDVGYVWHFKRGNFHAEQATSVYARAIKDWIIWLGGAIWTPHNIASVYSRGVETENKLSYQTGNCIWHGAVSTAYVLSTTASSYQPSDGSIGQQLPYTPRYNARLNVGFTYKKLYFNYNYVYTGYRFITADATAYLLPYQLSNLQASYATSIKKSYPITLTAQVNNIWSEQYYIVAARPSPGINWLLGLGIAMSQ
jgi:iron complex outermembrane receptor protein